MTDLAIVRCSERAKELTREMIEEISRQPKQGYAVEMFEYMSISPECWFAVLAQRGSAENFYRGVDGKRRIAIFCDVLFNTNGTCATPEVRPLDAAAFHPFKGKSGDRLDTVKRACKMLSCAATTVGAGYGGAYHVSADDMRSNAICRIKSTPAASVWTFADGKDQ